MAPRPNVWWYRTVEILCPGCNKEQIAEEIHFEGDPYSTYAHVCDCGYTILESEWEYTDRGNLCSQKPVTKHTTT